MKFEIEDVKKILDKLKYNPDNTLYTEHFLEKAECRKVDDVGVCDRLEYFDAKSIRKFPSWFNYFELVYLWDDDYDLVVIIHLLQPRDVVIITAFLEASLKLPRLVEALDF